MIVIVRRFPNEVVQVVERDIKLERVYEVQLQAMGTLVIVI